MRAVRALAVAALMIAGLPSGAAAGDRDATAEEQIAEAFHILGDFAATLDERAAVLEDGPRLRKVLRASAALADPATAADHLLEESAIPLPALTDPVFRDVTVRRMHRRSAEVTVGIFVGQQMVTGWSGVAVREGGRWKVSRGTFCSILADWTQIDCPGDPSSSDTPFARAGKRVEGRDVGDRRVALPIRFPDGSTAEVLVPKDLADPWRAQPMAAVTLGDGTTVDLWLHPSRFRARQPVVSYPDADGDRVLFDADFGLVIPAGDWTITAYVNERSERERKLVARHLGGRTSKDGFVVLDASEPLHLGRSSNIAKVKSSLDIERTALPVELTRSTNSSYTVLVVTLGPCPEALQRPLQSADYLAEERCLPGDDVRVAVEGQADVAGRLLDEVSVRNIRRPESRATEGAGFVV